MALSPVRMEELESSEALCEEWRALAATAGQGVPFSTWEWASAWQAHFMERRLLVHDQPMLHAFRSPSGELVGVAPLMLTRRPGALPFVRVVDFLGADPNVTELRGMLCHPEWEEACLRALLDRLLERRDEWDFAYLRGLREGGAGHALLEAQAGVTWDRETPAFTLALPATWEALKAGVSRNLKESLRHCYNSLRRDGHAFELEVVRAPAEIQPALHAFFGLHGARADLEGTIAHGNVFASDTVRRFMFDVCERLGRRDMVRIFQLRVAGEVVAARVGFALGDTLYLYFSGYQPAWSRYSVMTTTVAEAIRYAIGSGFGRVHLSMGADVSKTRWRPELVVHRDAVLVSPTVRSRVSRSVAASVGSRLSTPFFRRLLGRSFHAG